MVKVLVWRVLVCGSVWKVPAASAHLAAISLRVGNCTRLSLIKMIALLLATTALLPHAPTLSSHPPTTRHCSRALALRGGADMALLPALGAAYSSALVSNPIITKSLTSGAIFALSDQTAQGIESAERDLKRTLTSALVGLFYFGPALHYWLQMISRVLPGFAIKDTLCKTLLGQCFFGPTITCVFFGASLISMNGLAKGLAQWPKKIKQDLLVTWASGLCFWPFVDLFVYSFVPIAWIPLGYNVASFIWTIYLSIQATKSV